MRNPIAYIVSSYRVWQAMRKINQLPAVQRRLIREFVKKRVLLDRQITKREQQ